MERQAALIQEQEQLMDEQMMDIDVEDDKIDFNTYVDAEPKQKRSFQTR
jgi:hypothetical protein